MLIPAPGPTEEQARVQGAFYSTGVRSVSAVTRPA
jgi:hypothetical protein